MPQSETRHQFTRPAPPHPAAVSAPISGHSHEMRSAFSRRELGGPEAQGPGAWPSAFQLAPCGQPHQVTPPPPPTTLAGGACACALVPCFEGSKMRVGCGSSSGRSKSPRCISHMWRWELRRCIPPSKPVENWQINGGWANKANELLLRSNHPLPAWLFARAFGLVF
jgi:hypothetical protein